jgi:signal transduction histidine kinase
MGKWVYFFLFWALVTSVCAQTNQADYRKADSLFAAGLYARALEIRLKILEKLEQSGSCRTRAIAYLQIGRSYYYLKDPHAARKWIEKSLHQAHTCGFDSLEGINYRNLGALFAESHQPDSAILCINRAKNLLKFPKDLPEIANLYAILFEIQLRGNRDLTEARKCLDSCRRLYALIKDPNQTAFYKMKEGIYWLEMKNFEQAEIYFEQAGELYKSVSSTEGYMYALSSLAAARQEGGKYDKAYLTLKQYTDLRDTVFKAQTAKALAEYQTKFESQQKGLENLALQNRNERLTLGFGFGILVLIFGGFTFIKFRENQHNKRLEKQKREEQRMRFAEVVKAQEEERTRIARDLHDGIGHLMAAIKLNSCALDLKEPQNIQIQANTQQIIDQASSEVRQISHQLMPQTLSDLGLQASLQELAHRINKSGKITVSIEGEAIHQLDKAAEVSVYRIVQEVLNNCLKYAQASHFNIRHRVDLQQFIVTMEDNGIGFEPEKIQQSQGIGWKNMAARVELVSGKMEIFSAPGKGTKVEISIPLNQKST